MLKTLRGIKLLFFVVTAIKFAHDDKYLLACSSTDGTLSVCALVPSPPSVSCTLRGHTAAVTGRYKQFLDVNSNSQTQVF